MKKSILFALVALAVALGAAGCCSPCKKRAKNAKPLVGTEWHLVQFEGKDMNLPDDTFNILFNGEGGLSGIGGCNRLMSRYTSGDKGAITIKPVATTMAYCPEADFERELTLLLEKITHYDIDYDMLVLTQEGTVKAVFKALPARAEGAKAE